MLRTSSLALALLLACASSASAQVPLINGFGGARDFGSQCLGPNDDGSSRSIDLSPVFPAGLRFFDRTHTSMFVNTNGNITFSDQLPQYTPDAFPVADQPMIAPFWADVDIRFDPTDCEDNDGGSGYGGDCHSPSSNGVWWHVDTAGQRVVVTWDQVGYYDCQVDKEMNFQLVLSPAPETSCNSAGDFDVEFRFNRCEWNTGDASGGEAGLAPGTVDGMRDAPCMDLGPFGNVCPDLSACPPSGVCSVSVTPAQSGFDAGNSTDYVEIPGSRSNEIHTILCTDSNVGEPGIWRFQIRAGAVLCPDAGDACNTGGIGVCGIGRTACVGGATECRQDTMEGPERCDALDNDCDGSVDEGDALCTGVDVCDRGVCISPCFEGGCAEGLTCTDTGICLDDACVDVTCPEGQRCRLGTCVGACDGVVCPGELSCFAGQCVDACDGTTCDECTTCSSGACIARCAPGHCPSGQVCGESGRCVDAGCETMTCGVGHHCEGGACVDSCIGAVCPAGEVCAGGNCYPMGMIPPEADGGGVIPGFDAGAGRPPGMRGGCGCRAASTERSGLGLGLALMLGLLWIGRRRR